MSLNLAEKLKAYLNNIWFLWFLCLLVNIITLLFLYFKIHPGNKTLALHYNVLVGVQWYGKGKNLYYIPAVGLAITAVNFVLFRAGQDYEELLEFLPPFISLCAQLILFAAALSLAQVN